MQIGFSTGCFYKIVQTTSPEAIALVRSLNVPVIEIHAGYPDRIAALQTITPEDIKSFQYVSVHGLGSTEMNVLDESGKRAVLDTFQSVFNRLHFQALVFHPGDWVGDYSLFQGYTMPIVFENNDWRNVLGITSDDMQYILKITGRNMVMDLNHCYTHTTTMARARELYNACRGRIAHYHISDFAGDGEPEHLHAPFFQQRHDIIIHKAPGKTIPFIIESVLSSPEDAQRELEYIRERLTF